jgi:hypothetical protein
MQDTLDPQAALSDFTSGDAHRIWLACGAVRQSWDRASLRLLQARAADIRAATQGIDLGGMLRPNATHLDFALRKLQFAAGEACFCALYLTDDLCDPTRAAANGHIIILSETVDQAAYATSFRCGCLACGQHFAVREEAGYHYPWYAWTHATPEA